MIYETMRFFSPFGLDDIIFQIHISQILPIHLYVNLAKNIIISWSNNKKTSLNTPLFYFTHEMRRTSSTLFDFFMNCHR